MTAKKDYLKGALPTWCVRCTSAAKRKHHTTTQLKNWPNPPTRLGRFCLVGCTIAKHNTQCNARTVQPAYRTVGPFLLALFSSLLLGLGAKRSPHTGHSIRSKSTRRTSAGGIKPPHFRTHGIERRPHLFEINLLTAGHGLSILVPRTEDVANRENRGIVGGEF
jgi:hypothetical protein